MSAVSDRAFEAETHQETRPSQSPIPFDEGEWRYIYKEPSQKLPPQESPLRDSSYYTEPESAVPAKTTIEVDIVGSNAEINSAGSYEKMTAALRKIHNVDNEANKIRKMRESGLSEAEMRLYTHDQVVNQITEHSIGVPYNTLTIIAKPDGRFTMYGMDILQMYKETAEMTSEGSQQWSEYEAYKALYDKLNNGANVAAEVSPAYDPSLENPNPAQRSFAFLHTVGDYDPQLKGTIIKEHLLRWEDTPGALSKSVKVQQGIQYHAGLQPTPADQIHTRKQIVESPTAFVSSTPDNIDPFLQVVGISKEDIRFSREAKAMLEEGGVSLLENYHQQIEKLSRIENKNSVQYILTKSRAEALIEKAFVLGSKIRKFLKGDSNEHPYQHLETIQTLTRGNEAKYYESIHRSNRRNSSDLKIKGGSDCATVSESIGGVLGKATLEKTLHGKAAGKPHESNKACARCPLCGNVEPVRVIKGKYFCVECDEYGPEVDAKAA